MTWVIRSMSAKMSRASSATSPSKPGQPLSQRHPGLGPVQRRLRRIQVRVELMEVPAQPVDHPGPLTDQVFAPIHQQLQLPRHLIMGRDRQIRLPQYRPGHRQRIDRVGLPRVRADWPGPAPSASAAPAPPLPHRSASPAPTAPTNAGNPQSPTPDHRRTTYGPTATPSHDPSLSRSDGQLAQAAADHIDRDERVRPLVHIGTNNNHGGCLLVSTSLTGRLGRSADNPQWGRSHAPIKSRRPVRHTRCRQNA